MDSKPQSTTEHTGICVVRLSGKIGSVRVKDFFGKNVIEIPPRAYVRRRIQPPIESLPPCDSASEGPIREQEVGRTICPGAKPQTSESRNRNKRGVSEKPNE